MRKETLRLTFFATICFVLTTANSYTQPVIGFSSFVSSGLTSPVRITNAGDGTNRLFIVEQGGTIRIRSGTTVLPTAFLNITSIVLSGGERGLLGLAFHPDYENLANRYFFVYYNNLSGDITIARYQAQAGDPNQADAASGVVLMTIPKPFDNHNGGDMHFGPDGYLYFATGDGGSGGDPNNLAQNGTSLLGKMIRIDVNNFSTPPYYTIPPDNPYLADPLVDDRIWALGLRNPWRWSFDRATNDLWVADVGQGAWEEVNFRTNGTTGGINYGWRCYEGSAPFNTAGCGPAASYVTPIFEYPHNFATGGFSITGGFVFRGPDHPDLLGYYICADFVSGNVWLIRPNGVGGWFVRRQSGLPGNISGFGEAEDGSLYAVSLNGTVYNIVITSVLPSTFISFSGRTFEGYNELKWKTATEQNLRRFIIEYSTNGNDYQQAGDVPASNRPEGNLYTFNHHTLLQGKIFYRIRIEDADGSENYSPVILLGKDGRADIKVFPSVITNGLLQLNSTTSLRQVAVFDNSGKQLLVKPLNGANGYQAIPLPALARGIYYVEVSGIDIKQVHKVLIQ